jgi:DNA-binding LacI/PurR family transcriptional regulator
MVTNEHCGKAESLCLGLTSKSSGKSSKQLQKVSPTLQNTSDDDDNPNCGLCGGGRSNTLQLAEEIAVTVTDTRIAATPPTLADVAELAGVSSATASRVLTGSAKVSPQTRDRVEEAMARLGYVRNRAPRASQPRRAGSIALVVGEESVKVFADPFFARMLRSVSNSLVAADLQLILLTLHSPREYRTVSRYLRSGHVDGALFVSMHGRPDFDYASLGVPIVLCGRPFSGGEKLSYVDADNVSGAWKAVKYLLDNGRRAIATIAGPPDMAPGIDRLLGYRKAMTAADAADPGMIAYGDFQSASGEHALFRLIDHRPAIDSVFAASDLMAAGALRALRRLGRRVPDDVAVIGFDDSPSAQQARPKLTTVRQPVDAMAARMVGELLAQIANPGRQPSHIVLDTELVLRDSA